MHSVLIAETGGLDGVRDMNLLDGSVNSPYHTFGGQNLYPTVQAEELTKLGLGLPAGGIDEAAVIDWIVERS